MAKSGVFFPYLGGNSEIEIWWVFSCECCRLILYSVFWYFLNSSGVYICVYMNKLTHICNDDEEKNLLSNGRKQISVFFQIQFCKCATETTDRVCVLCIHLTSIKYAYTKMS